MIPLWSVDRGWSNELSVHASDTVRRPSSEVIGEALPADVGKIVLHELHYTLSAGDQLTELLRFLHGILHNAADAVVATFEVRGCSEVVLHEKAELPYTARQKAKVALALVLFGAAVREHEHSRHPVVLPRRYSS